MTSATCPLPSSLATIARTLGLLVLCLCVGAPPLRAQAPVQRADTALDRFLDGLVSWQTEFAQSTTDSRGRAREPQRGRLIVQRPGRFRWEVAMPQQIMVNDGRNLWFHDVDLEQVTVRRADEVLSASPAMLLAGSVPLRSAFKVVAAGRREGLEWVRATPLRADAEFREARFGFVGAELRRLEIDDKLGQRTVLMFSASLRNVPVEAAELRFVPPPGADVIGTPVP